MDTINVPPDYILTTHRECFTCPTVGYVRQAEW